jgi:hypothetical protein
MNKEKLKRFLIEFNQLGNKHGISIKAETVETIDYDWNEVPFVSGISSQLVFIDDEDNEMTLNDLDIDDLADIDNNFGSDN